MTDTKATPSLDPRRSAAGPRTTLDNAESDKGMPSVGDVVLYQLAPDVHGLAFSRPMIVTSVNSINQHVNGYLFLDFAMDSIGNVHGAKANVSYGGPGQSDTWHWPVKGYTGRADSPVLTPLSSVEVAEEVATVAAANTAVEAEAVEKADTKAQAELDAAAEEAATETHPRRAKGEKHSK